MLTWIYKTLYEYNPGRARRKYHLPRLSGMAGEKGITVTKQFSGGSPLQTRADGKSDQVRAH